MSAAANPADSVDWMRSRQFWGVFDDSKPVESGYSHCLWNAEAHKMFKTKPDNQASTMVELLEKSKAKYGARRCAGSRKLVKTHMVPDRNGRVWEKLELRNEYSWLSYQEYYDRVLTVARGLHFLGVEPKSKVVIYAETQRDWMICAFAAWFLNAQVVTIYATLGAEGAAHGISETEASLVIVDSKLLNPLATALPKCPTVKSIITLGTCDEPASEALKESGIKVDSLDNVAEAGKTWAMHLSLPSPEDVAVIMYTSGTTGAPKGVVISHGNIVATVAGVEHTLKGLVSCEDVYMAYLPLAHILEMAAECVILGLGGVLGFGHPSTLLSTGDASKKLFTEPSKQDLAQIRDLANFKPQVAYSEGDAALLSPTIMVFPPAVLDKLYQNVSAKFKGAKLGWLLRAGLRSGDRHINRGQVGANPLFNLAFKQVQKAVGGKLKAVISGSAPLSPEVQRFVQTVFAVPVRQGYGLTETCAASTVAFWADQELRSVGPPTVNTTIRLADWAEGNYMVSDKDKPEVGMPRGEVLIGGPSVSQGYYMNPKKPSEDLAKKNKEDWVTIAGVRYFRSGDIGQITASGSLQIIDRKKDLWKGPNGEYVALAKVEQALTLCPYVQLAMCYAKTGEEKLVALVCPQPSKIMDLGKELKVEGPLASLCNDERVVDVVLKACQATCKEQKLNAFETPQKMALVPDVWTPENDMLTAALKLKRPTIAARHEAEIQKMYECPATRQ